MGIALQHGASSLSEADKARASRLFAMAFTDDPLMRYALPNPRRRRTALYWLFERTIEYGLRYGTVVVAPHVEAASIWFGPDNTKMTVLRELRSGLIVAPMRLGLKGTFRLGAYDKLRQQMHEQCIRGPHLYLFAAAVHPAAQNQGLARSVIQPMLDRADESGLRCYLETTNEVNLSIFAKFGFSPALHDTINRSGHRLHIWAMLREPAGAGPDVSLA